MAKRRHVYAKDINGFGDFIYVDLLPEVRRSRQFNVNVISTLLFAIILMFFFIYRPYSAAIFELEELSGINNDLKHELTLTQEEFTGYEIDLEVIEFSEDIDDIKTLKVNFNNLMDDVELIVDTFGGRILEVQYNSERELLQIEVLSVSQFAYNNINNQILNLSWVDDASYTTPTALANQVEYSSIFVIEVNYNVE